MLFLRRVNRLLCPLSSPFSRPVPPFAGDPLFLIVPLLKYTLINIHCARYLSLWNSLRIECPPSRCLVKTKIYRQPPNGIISSLRLLYSGLYWTKRRLLLFERSLYSRGAVDGQITRIGWQRKEGRKDSLSVAAVRGPRCGTSGNRFAASPRPCGERRD